MRNKQIEKVSWRLFIVISVLAACLLLLSAVAYPDLPAHMFIHVNSWGEGNPSGPKSSISIWPAVPFGLSIYQRSYQSIQPYGRWLKVLSTIVSLGALLSTLRLSIHLLVWRGRKVRK